VGVNDQPAWSRDGKQLVFRSQRGQKSGASSSVVSILSTDTGKLREVTPKLTEFSSPNLLADGQTIVLVGPMKEGRATTYKINEQTGDATPYDLTPAAMGLARKFAFRASGNSILARNHETGEEKVIYQASESTYRLLVTAGSISPDGQRLSFTSTEDDRGESTLSVVQADSGQSRTLITLKTPERFQRPPNNGWLWWTNDGRYILFVKKPNAKAAAELWRIAAEGGQPQYLELAMEELHDVRLNPDGRQLAFTAGSKRKPEIWVMENFLPKQNPKAQSRAVAGKH
jgi:Tol biopolymer transport system component